MKLPKQYTHDALDLSRLPKISAPVRRAVLSYSGEGYDSLNSYLRKPVRAACEYNDPKHAALKKALVPLKNDLVVWRGAFWDRARPGVPQYREDNWVDPAWVSTSLVRKRAASFGYLNEASQLEYYQRMERYLLRIIVPKGIKVIPTLSILHLVKQEGYDPENITEREITLPPNLAYEVVCRRKSTNKKGVTYTHLDVHVKGK